MNKQINVCFFGYDDRDEGGRAWTILTGLAENGIRIEMCRTDRTSVKGFVSKYKDLYRKWKNITSDIDALYVIFMGYYLMPLAWYLARRRGIPVILDTLVSHYDTEVTDRKRISRFSLRALFLWATDFISCFIADAIVVDTNEHKTFFIQTFFVNPQKIIIVPVGCRSDLFIPFPQPKREGDECIVEFHGGFSPLHGVAYIMEAAKILQDRNEQVHFEIVGAGQLFTAITSMAKKSRLTNVEFFGMKLLQELPYSVARADICLGIFGTSPKALRIVPHKVYECLSCGKPVITERSPAALEVLRDREDVYMVEPGNGADLAEKILELKRDAASRARLGERGRLMSLSTFSPHTIVNPLVEWLNSHV